MIITHLNLGILLTRIWRSMVDVRIAGARSSTKPNVSAEISNLVTPGDVITADTGFMRGHGTYMEDEKLYASVAGVVERVNKLICVKPLKTRYNGEIGDVVIGRILEVGTRRWKVDTHAKLDSVLMLSSVNLPGGELRRRSEEDEKMMRHYLKEGDLISAEVQSLFSDGALSLHTRSLKYGKLSQGQLVSISPSLIKRRKTHFHNLPCGASIILGNNGYVWICPTINEEVEQTGGYEQNLEPIQKSDREVIARLRNCVLALAEHKMMLYDTSVLYTFEASLRYSVKETVKPEVMADIIEVAQQRLEREGT
ncbi:exosome complex component RRP4-like [Mizuhopecten yessoensis]|uniref:Exosome complex component RRP4 n=1 Tax=Mizuhopecten yessoensis TaxID=6573 RepID=A0A210R138_MIZYE|nr:exosome complex component RRP4-like [Mizuhopecten yessoensis]OWF54694.1 Exosome complex component RRP4 [Mizuhopecten yessoensis]